LVSGSPRFARAAAAAGAHEFLTKPVDFDRLKEELVRLSAPPA
jgi:hypothetical protein